MKTLTLIFLWWTSLVSQTIDMGVKQDKLAHFGAGALVSSSTYTLIYKYTKSAPKSLIYSTASAFLVGAAKEVYDKSNGNNFDTEDLLATAFGGLMTSTIFTISVKDKNKEKQLKKIEQFKNEEPLPVEIPLAVKRAKKDIYIDE